MTISTLITVIYTFSYLCISLFLCRGARLNTHALTMTGLACGLTVILSMFYIPLPTGSSITWGSMLPLMVLAVVCDFRLAIIGGWVCAVLAVFFVPGWQLVHWGQFFVEHMVCFSCLGCTGLFANGSRVRLLSGAVLAAVLKVTGHILSGVLFFSQNAWDGWGAWGYSLTYNLSSNIPESILSIIILMMLPLPALKKVIQGGQCI